MKRICSAVIVWLAAALAASASAVSRPAPGAPPAPTAAGTAWAGALPWVAGLVALVILLAWWQSRSRGGK